MNESFDILVVGAGPSGLAVTAELAARGVGVANLAPSHPPAWPNTYGMWVDELRAAGFEDCARHTWSTPRVILDDERTHDLERPYAMVDNAGLRDTLVERAEDGGVTWLTGLAREAEADDEGVTVTTRDGITHRARFVIDATGHEPALVRRPEGNPAYQQGYGVVLRLDADPLDGDGMWLMDYRPLEGLEGLEAGGQPEQGRQSRRAGDDGPPSFLYAMDLGEGRYFLEETFLARRPRVDFQQLERRLAARMDQLGIDPGLLDQPERIEDAERVMIPMGVPLPEDSRPIVGFGGAAGMVHPATGYMVAHALKMAPEVARAGATALERRDWPAGRAAGHIRATLWPTDAVRTRRLLRFGLETLLTLDAAGTRRFFDAFFEMPDEDWRDYLSGRLAPGRCSRIMWTMFRDGSLQLKRDLGGALFSSKAAGIAKDFLG